MSEVSLNSNDQLLNRQVMEIQKPDSMLQLEPEPEHDSENNVDEEDHRDGDASKGASEDEDDLHYTPWTSDHLICLMCGTRVASTEILRRHTAKYHPRDNAELFEHMIKKAVEISPRIYAIHQTKTLKVNSKSFDGSTSKTETEFRPGAIQPEPGTSTSTRLAEGSCGSGGSEVSTKFPNEVIAPKSSHNSAYCHGKEKPFTCEYCGVKYDFKSQYNRHLRTHTREKPFICPECGKGFQRKCGLKQHMRTHTKKLNTH